MRSVHTRGNMCGKTTISVATKRAAPIWNPIDSENGFVSSPHVPFTFDRIGQKIGCVQLMLKHHVIRSQNKIHCQFMNNKFVAASNMAARTSLFNGTQENPLTVVFAVGSGVTRGIT